MGQDKVNLEQSQSENFGISSQLIQQPSRVNLITQNPEQVTFMQEIQEAKKQNIKYTMERLCRSFMKKYAYTDRRIQPSTITQQCAAKLRRVYDLTNILQGGGIIQKVEKGVSKWKQDFQDFRFQNEPVRNDWCSLKSISSQIRHFFSTSQNGLSCNDVYNLLTKDITQGYNPSTIRRRIYECCKVFTIVGLIQKIGKLYYKTKLEKREIHQLINQNMSGQSDKNFIQIKNQRLKQIKQKRQNLKNQGLFNMENMLFQGPKNRKEVIKKLVTSIKNSSELQSFIKELTIEYQKRTHCIKQEMKTKQIYSPFSIFIPNQDKVQGEKQNKMINQNQVQQVAQVQKTIIISSPSNSYPFLVSKNSNFCSFSQNQMLKMCPSMQKPRNVRGN